MHRVLLAILVMFPIFASAGVPENAPFKKVVIVVFENTNMNDVLAQPTFYDIARSGTFFSNFHAVTRPSQPNYFAMISGETFGINNNNSITLTEASIVNSLDKQGLTWKVYAENYPGKCFLGDKTDDGLYVRKHNPFISYSYITSDRDRCARIVNANEFMTDIAKSDLPDFSFYIPNLINNGHNNGSDGTDGIVYADRWLKDFQKNAMDNPYVINSEVLFVLTFDESDPKGTPEDIADNLVYTVFSGPMVNMTEINEYYTFFNLLRTIEDAWDLEKLGRSVDENIWVP